MGMSASQARLLSITARIHDVEYEAQAIQNAKLQLSTQSDQVYNEYLAALDAETLTISTLNSDGSTSTITANFNNIASSQHVLASDGSRYSFFDNRGRLILENDVYDAYKNYEGEADPYLFACYMLGSERYGLENKVSASDLEKVEEQIYGTDGDRLSGLRKEILELNGSDDIYNIEKFCYENGDVKEGMEEEYKKYQDLMNKYKYQLYNKNSENIYNALLVENGYFEEQSDFDYGKFNYYVDIFKQIEMSGGLKGCVAIRDFDGPHGDAGNDSEWLQGMLKSGQITISTYKNDKTTGEITYNSTGVSSDTSLSYTATSTVDKSALKKAEAKYEHDLKEIDKKDKQYDMTLSKLETERNALTTEYDSVKKVIEENIERTFGIFS